jgi:hypothetical protein
MRCALAAVVAFALVAACSAFAAEDTPGAAGNGATDGSAPPPNTNDEGGGGGDGATVGPPPTSAPQTLLTAAGPPSNLATDGSFIYWIEAGVRIMRAPIQGGGIPTQIGGTETSIDALVVDKSYIVWAAPTLKTLSTANLGTVAVASVNTLPGPSLVMHGSIYWLDAAYNRLLSCTTPCAVPDLLTDATSPALLATGSAHLFYFATVDGGARGLQALAHTAVAPATTLATSGSPLFLAASGNRAFWVDGADATLRTVVVTAVPNVVPLGAVPPSTSSIGAGADGLTVYVTTLTEVLAFSATSPGTRTSVAQGEKQPSYVVATAGQVIWANLDDNTIRYASIH